MDAFPPSKPRNKPSLGHFYIVSFILQNVLMTLFPLVWSADTSPVHAHNCTTRTTQPAWFGKNRFFKNHRVRQSAELVAAQKPSM